MNLKMIFAGAAGLSLCVSQSACLGLPGTGGSGSDWSKAAVEIAKDPSCGHTDILDVMLGPVPSGHVHLERSGCKTAKAPTTGGVSTGAVVAGPDPAKTPPAP